MGPPSVENVEIAIDGLERLGAFIKTPGENEAEVISFVGHRLAQLPVHPSIGRMLLYSALFQCLEPMTTVAACIGGRGAFVQSPALREESQAAQRQFSTFSDVAAMTNAFDQWAAVKREYGTKVVRVLSSEQLFNLFGLMRPSILWCTWPFRACYREYLPLQLTHANATLHGEGGVRLVTQ